MAFDELREEYQGSALHEQNCDPEPALQFKRWMDEAIAAEVDMANAMTLATVDKHGAPHARIVLLKELDPSGFVFFTNYQSRKGDELATDHRAALLFYWHTMQRQVRIEGVVEKISGGESDQYFASRPRGSNLVAMASKQSRVVESREALLSAIDTLKADVGESEISRPAHWGGYRLKPALFEFWQGQPDRSHDRLEYQRNTRGVWSLTRLFP